MKLSLSSRSHLYVIALIFGGVLLSQTPSISMASDDALNGFSVGINYPGVGLRYFWNNWGLSGKAQWTSDTNAVGGRLTRHFSIGGEGRYVYIGGEASFFDFENPDTKFTTEGNIYGGFVGYEQFLGNRFSISLDVGPYYSTTEKDSLDEDLTEAVANTSLDFHFGGGRK